MGNDECCEPQGYDDSAERGEAEWAYQQDQDAKAQWEQAESDGGRAEAEAKAQEEQSHETPELLKGEGR